MRRIGLAVLVGGLLLSVLTGCWNRRELNDLGIQMGTAIDKVGNQYRLSVQVVVPGEVSSRKSSGGYSPVTMYKTTASTLFEAFRKLTEISPRKIYGAHIRVLVLGESLAKEGIAKVLDLLVRDPEVRTDFYVMIARDTSAESVLKIMTTLEKIPADKLFHSLDISAKSWAPTTTVTLDQLVEKMITEGDSPALTGIRVTGNPNVGEKKQNMEEIDPAAKLRYSGLAVMKGDRLIGWLNEQESKGYNYIKNQVTSTAGSLECPGGGLITLETIHSHTDMKGRIVDGEPVVEIKLRDESNVADVSCKIDLEDPETIRRLEEAQAHKKTELMEKAVDVVKSKYKSDIFGFGQAIYRADPRAWRRLKKDWEEHFSKLKVVYNVDVHIRMIGMTNTSIFDNLKE